MIASTLASEPPVALESHFAAISATAFSHAVNLASTSTSYFDIDAPLADLPAVPFAIFNNETLTYLYPTSHN